MIKAGLFDLDGVITDTACFHFLAWQKTARKLGGDIDEEFNETLKGVNRYQSLKNILNHINVEATEDEIAQMMIDKNEDYLLMLNDLKHENILPGIEQLFQNLKDQNIKIIIASASENAPFILEKLQLEKYVDAIANPRAVVNNKPAPDIFLLAAELAGCEVDECIGFEDSQAGIDALAAANIKSIGIGQTPLNGATIQVSSTDQLLELNLNEIN